MIILLCAIWLTLVCYVGYKYFGNKDTFGPVKLFTTKMVIMNLPFLYFMYLYPEKFSRKVLDVIDTDIETAFFNYTVVATIMYIFILVGINLNKSINFFLSKKIVNYSIVKVYTIITLILFLLGLYSYYKFITSVGGLAYLIANLSKRTEFLNEGEGLGNTVFYLTLSCVIFTYTYFKKKSNLKLLFLVLLVVTTILILTTTGSRKNVLYLIIFVLGAINYYYKPINIKTINKKYITVLGIIISFYILIVPVLRQKDGFQKIQNGEIELVEVLKVEDLIYQISYTYIDIFAANYFNFSNYWYLKSPLDILENFKTIPKYSKPPIDDGVYFRTIAEYKSYKIPPEPRGKMYNSSWPIEHFGFSFANLGYIGIILFSIMLGIIYRGIYNIMVINRYEPILMYLYIFTIFNFNFSNLRLVQFLGFLPLVIIYIIISRILHKK